MLGWRCNNFGVVVNELLADGSAKELEVTITKTSIHSTKQPDCGKDGVQ
jgi:hypothetical protein